MLQLFAPSQEFFAAVSADNRLKVWDVVRGSLCLCKRAFQELLGRPRAPIEWMQNGKLD